MRDSLNPLSHFYSFCYVDLQGVLIMETWYSNSCLSLQVFTTLARRPWKTFVKIESRPCHESWLSKCVLTKAFEINTNYKVGSRRCFFYCQSLYWGHTILWNCSESIHFYGLISRIKKWLVKSKRFKKMDSIPSPSPSVKIQIIGGKFTEGEGDGIKSRLPLKFLSTP